MVRPFKIGIGSEIEALLKSDAALPELRKALRRYTRSAGYLLAMAQPDANRHGINGEPVEPVSEGDRLNARQSFAAIQQHRKRLRLQREAAQALENSSLTA
jgi:sRNA-binding protein